MPSLEYNTADPVKRENEEKNADKKELSRFKKLMEKGKEFMVKPLTWIIVGATVTFMACGDPGNKPDEDVDQDTTEEVDGDTEVDAPDIPDVIEDDSPDVIDDETDVGDGEDAELPPLECEEPVEETPPALNPVFEANVSDSVSSTGGEISADTDLHMSMVPASYEECLNSGEGGYELVCVGDTVTVDGEYYLQAENVDATLPPASSETEVCPTITEDYPVIVYAGSTPETIKNAVYDFSGYTVDSIAGFSMDEPGSFYFDIGGAREDVVALSFTPSSADTYPIYFMRDAASVAFNARSFDGRGTEVTNNYNADMVEGSSKPLYLVAANTDDVVHYGVEGIPSTYGGTLNLVVCTRLVGIRTDRLTVALDTEEGASTFNIVCPLPHDDCGCIGEEVNLSLSDITTSNSGLVGGEMNVTVTLLTPTINSPDDIPEVQVDYEYVGSGSLGIAVEISANMTLNIDGTNVCSGGAPFHEHYRFRVLAYDPWDYEYSSSCGGSFDPTAR